MDTQKLEQAARLLNEVLATLDRSTTFCECCGRDKWNNRDQYQLALEIEALARKARKLNVDVGRLGQHDRS